MASRVRSQMMSCSRTSYGKASVLKPVQSNETDGVQVVVVHDLQLLPHYRPGLTLQQTQTSETKTRTRSFGLQNPSPTRTYYTACETGLRAHPCSRILAVHLCLRSSQTYELLLVGSAQRRGRGPQTPPAGITTGIRLKGESCRKCQREGVGYLIILPLAM